MSNRVRAPGCCALCQRFLGRCDVVVEQLPGQVEPAETRAFRAFNALAADDIGWDAYIVDLTDAAASPAGDLLDDRELRLVRMMDCTHTGRIDRQERLGNASHAPGCSAAPTGLPMTGTSPHGTEGLRNSSLDQTRPRNTARTRLTVTMVSSSRRPMSGPNLLRDGVRGLSPRQRFATSGQQGAGGTALLHVRASGNCGCAARDEDVVDRFCVYYGPSARLRTTARRTPARLS
jgi:hypothetical protein